MLSTNVLENPKRTLTTASVLVCWEMVHFILCDNSYTTPLPGARPYVVTGLGPDWPDSRREAASLRLQNGDHAGAVSDTGTRLGAKLPKRKLDVSSRLRGLTLLTFPLGATAATQIKAAREFWENYWLLRYPI